MNNKINRAILLVALCLGGGFIENRPMNDIESSSEISLKTESKKIIKKKEALVLSYLDKNIKTDINPIDDRVIDTSCVKRRPDRVYDCGSYFLIVEIDENQHIDYNSSCENKRLMEISQDLQHRPIVFIRFNPDGYIDENNDKIDSCWKINKLGILKILKSKEAEWQNRIDKLIDQIEYWIKNTSDKTIEIIELFY